MSGRFERSGFSTFRGVFTPTLLTILGVIMYLRTGWVVGEAGLLGGLLVISLAMGIAMLTGLSIASTASNTRLGAGGPYAIIAGSLGIEVGGSVGIPLFLSQVLAVAMYVIGFRAGWLWVFPDHPALAVDAGVVALMFGLAWWSADLAFRVQYVVMAIIAVSIAAILAGPSAWSGAHEPSLWGPQGDVAGNFWAVFAVFFPAATGLMAGVNMSGELKDPRRSIPIGTLSAILVATVIYGLLALWTGHAASPEELRTSETVLIDKASWGPAVIAGLLAATFSSGLSSLVGAPRILQALGRDRVIPFGAWLQASGANDEPRRALAASTILVGGALALRDLNTVAPLITMFFLITYATINVVVLIEDVLQLSSFRPTFSVPRIVPLLGAAGSIFAMFIVNPTFGIVAVAVVVAVHGWVLRQGVRRTDDVRSGIFVAFAEWAAARVVELDRVNPRAWKPNLLAPVTDSAELRGAWALLLDVCRPEGSIQLLGIEAGVDDPDLDREIAQLAREMHRNGLFTTWSCLRAANYHDGAATAIGALGGGFFRPNIVFLQLAGDDGHRDAIKRLCDNARATGLGVLLLGPHPLAGLGRLSTVNLWLRPTDLPPWPTDESRPHIHLAILCALRLAAAWTGQLRIIAVVDDADDSPDTRARIRELRDLARVPAAAATVVLTGSLIERLHDAPLADLDIFGMGNTPQPERIDAIVAATRSACLFCSDSGAENAQA